MCRIETAPVRGGDSAQADGDIMAGLHSECLREMAADWDLNDISTSPAVAPGQLNSEYLRDIAADW